MTTLSEDVERRGAMIPRPHRVRARRQVSHDTWTLELDPVDGRPVAIGPGQFTMLYAFGIGEVPISNGGGGPGEENRLVQTVRVVGAVTRALCATEPGGVVGVRGPFGNTWPVARARGGDVVFVAGGLGLPPLRPAIHQVLRDRDGYGRVLLLYGARTPADLLFLDEIETWRQAHGVDVGLVVDAGGPGWSGEVGLVTKLIPGIELDAGTATAFVAGPEIMMRFVAEDLHTRGLDLDSVHVTLERTMRCGVALCGRCQVGPTLVCRDGAVYRYSDVGPLLSVKEL